MKKQLTFIFLFLFLFLQEFSNAQCWETAKAGFAGGTAIRTDGTLWAWGQNDFGALGDGTFITKKNPIQIGTDGNWKTLSCGDNNVAAIKKDGSLWVWGFSIYPDKSNDSTFFKSNTPAPIDSSKDWQSIFVMKDVLAIKKDGTLWGWGNNWYGQLGNGTNKSSNKLKQIGIDNDWQNVFLGYYYSFGIKKNGTLWMWGLNRFVSPSLGNSRRNSEITKPTQIGIDNDWSAIQFYRDGCIGLKKNGTLWIWDGQSQGCLYISKTLPTQLGKDNDWRTLSVGMYGDFVMAIKNNGSLWAWGANHNGQLGNGTLIEKDAPIQIGSSFDWKSVSTGGLHTIACKIDGSIYSWGNNRVSQLGNGDTQLVVTEPQQIPTNDCVFPKPKTIEPFNLFPNPSSGFITIKGEDTDNADILIYNLVGQLVKMTKLQNKTFDVSELASGAYLLYIRTENQVLFAKKIIKI